MPGFIIEKRTCVSRNLKLTSIHKVNNLESIDKETTSMSVHGCEGHVYQVRGGTKKRKFT